MSSGAKQEILWSPVHKDKFISWGTDLGLYEVASLNEIEKKPACIKLSESTGAHLVASNGNHHYVKCVDIYPKEDPDLLLALGQANGKIVLTTFGPTNFDTLGINGKELVPRYARTCNSVAWNRTEPSIIGAALDKYRNDHCILLWDIMKCSGGSTSPRTSSNGFMYNAATAVELARPIAEMGLSETAHSLAWPQGQSRTLVVGMNQKQIKMFDLRDFSNKAVTVTSSKYVYDVCVDPFKDYQLASRADATICVWDARSFDKPLLTLHQAKPVTKILWCPTRQNLLGSLQIDSCSLRLHDVQHTPTQPLLCNTPTCELPTNMTPTALERNVSPGSPHIITSFSWHPTHQCRLLTIALSGSITDYTVSERITLNWGPGSGQIVWSHGHKTLHMLPESFYASLDDISFKMKRRANTDYGLRPDFAQNGDLADDENLKHLWQWLYLSKSLVEEGCIRGTSSKHPGVKTVLKMEGNATPSSNGSSQTSYRSETVMSAFMSQSADFGTLHNLTYRSEERSRALQLCGWSWEAEGSSLLASLERVEAEGCPARAAALAAFHLRLRPAIDILNRAHQKSSSQSAASGGLGVVALALAGYSEERGGLWRALCSAVRPTLHDPYLQALFAFLVADNGCYDTVLNECDMSVEDRVAFACMFLSDSKLADFIRHLTNKVVEEGNLSGFLLTGTSSEGLQLLQNYVERTGDVQSATLLAARALPHDLLSDSRVQHWITSYRTLLDSWRLWWRRGLLDIALCAGAPPAPGVPLSTPAVAPAPLGVSKPHQQVYISCNYCGKTISAYPQGLTRTRSTFARIAASSNKLKQISACPNCRKPLPRCAVCLLHMGTGSGTGAREPHKTVTFPSWFTWCQACRHGGHADHIMQWFKEHIECPVTSCTCRCLSADITSQNI